MKSKNLVNLTLGFILGMTFGIMLFGMLINSRIVSYQNTIETLQDTIFTSRNK
jgi:hypothetical protein